MSLWWNIIKQEVPKWYRWLILDTRFFLIAIGGSVLPMLPPIMCSAAYSELWFRSWGALLQLAGIITTVITIWKTLRDAKKPTAWQILTVWWNRRPSRLLTPHAMSSIINVGDASSTKGTMNIGPNFPTDTDARIIELIEKMRRLDEHHIQEVRRLDDRIDDMKNFVHQVRQESDAGDKAIGAQLIEGQTGNLHWAAMGAWWLFIGVILSGWAAELAKYLRLVN